MPVPMFTVNHDGVKLVIRSSQCHPVVHTSRAECLDLDAILRGTAGLSDLARRRARRCQAA